MAHLSTQKGFVYFFQGIERNILNVKRLFGIMTLFNY